MLASVLDLMQQDIELESNSKVRKAFKRLAYLEPSVLERWVSQFKASLQVSATTYWMSRFLSYPFDKSLGFPPTDEEFYVADHGGSVANPHVDLSTSVTSTHGMGNPRTGKHVSNR